MPEDIIRVTLDVRPAAKMDGGPVFNRLQRLIENSGEFTVITGSARRLILAQPHPHDQFDGREWPKCAICDIDSNFALNGVVQTLCYEHHPSGRSSTPLPELSEAELHKWGSGHPNA